MVQDLVKEFHEAFGHPINNKPTLVSDDEAYLREQLITEENEEFIDASINKNLTAIADALGDLVYVCYGTALVYGIDLDKVIEEIHASNMTKLQPDGSVLYRADGKVLKGPDYREPDIHGVIYGRAEEAL